MREKTEGRNVQAAEKPRGEARDSRLHPSPPGFDSIFGLQRDLGNQAMLGLLNTGIVRAKLRVSQPGDADEQEADRAAEQIVTRRSEPAIHRKCACSGGTPCSKCAGEEEELIHRSASRPSLASYPLALQRAPAEPPSTVAESAPAGSAGMRRVQPLIVEDDTESLAPGQMKKSAFFDQLQADICSAADAELAAVGRSSKSCPYIEKWIGFYGAQSSAHIEQSILKYAPEAAGATSARDYFAHIRTRVRRSAAIWAKTGKVTGIPPGVGMLPSGDAAGKSDTGKSSPARAAGVQKKERDGASATPTDAAGVRARLGHGRPLESRVRDRMGSAFGRDFSSVRVHDDASAASLSNQLDARAFTLGSDVAFASGEYRPGTLVGDALIAHELAHVVQQGEAAAPSAPMKKSEGEYNDLERDADRSAVGAVLSLWTGARGKAADLARHASPRMKSGLRLQRCGGGDCPPGWCWQVFAADAGIATCTCHWRCSSTPTSGMAYEDPYAPRPSIPTDYRHNIGALGSTTTIITAGCLCPDLPQDRGAVCGTTRVVEPTSDFRDLGGGIAGVVEGKSGGKAPEHTRDPKAETHIEGPAVAGGAKGSTIKDDPLGAGKGAPKVGAPEIKDEGAGKAPAAPPPAAPPVKDEGAGKAPAAPPPVAPPVKDEGAGKAPAAPPPVAPPVKDEGAGKAPAAPPPVAPPVKDEGAGKAPAAPPPAKDEGAGKAPAAPPPAKDEGAAKAASASEKKTEPPSGTTAPPAATVDKAQQLQKVKADVAANFAKMAELDQKRLAALDREREASSAAKNAEGATRDALLEKARRNRESAERWKNERDEVRIANNRLLDELARLEPAVKPPQTWQEAENALRKEFSGTKKTFVLAGGNREVDCFSDDKVAREAKFGPQGLSEDRIQVELNKDIELLKSKAVKAVEWHFYENVKGEGGPSGPLRDALQKAGIRIVKHY
jgi:hypothetical protein